VKKLRRYPMRIYDFKVLLEPDDEVGGYVVTCPALPGCYTQGDTIDQALENIKEAILLCLEDLEAQNQPIPDMSKILISSVAVAV
jgi:antitoxin HicB